MSKPFSIEARYTVPAANLAEAERLRERLDAFARDQLALLGEGGHVEQMKPGDVVPGSPLARQLSG